MEEEGIQSMQSIACRSDIITVRYFIMSFLFHSDYLQSGFSWKHTMSINTLSRVAAALCFSMHNDKVRLTLKETEFYRVNGLADKGWRQEGRRAYFCSFLFWRRWGI